LLLAWGGDLVYVLGSGGNYYIFYEDFVDDLCGGAWYRDKLEERFSLSQAKKTYSSRLFWIPSI